MPFMTWTRKHTLVAGLALVALTNAVALGGVAWNRSGTPESELKLTQRELWDTYAYRYDRDAGTSELNLRWRMLSADDDSVYYEYSSGTPEWLDEAKLAELGYDISKPPAARRDGRRYYNTRVLPREALIVLELDGPAARKALERARARLAKEQSKTPAPGSKTEQNRVTMATEALKREETSNSRLFAIDVGRDAAALRAKYPDRARYAIVRGKVRAQPPALYGNGKDRRWRGYIESLDSPRINVPLAFRRQASLPLRIAPADSKESGPRFEVTVAFGKRFEPWVTAVAVAK